MALAASGRPLLRWLDVVMEGAALRRCLVAEYHPRIRSVERGNIPPCLELIDDPGRPGVPDSQTPLEQRRRGTIVLPDDRDGIRQQPVGQVVRVEPVDSLLRYR